VASVLSGGAAVLRQPYSPEEIHIAWCYRVYYRWRTHRASLQPALARLDRDTLDSLVRDYGIHVLETSASATDVKVLASLSPAETVAACASKMKGRVTKWLRARSNAPSAQKLLGRGYFACTTGTSTAQAVQGYLDAQGEHHGYMERAAPPVFVARYPTTPDDECRLSTDHAVTVLQFHIVLSTWQRKGVFGRRTAEAVADCWRRLQSHEPMFVEKVSFLPDHVHLAVRLHPSMSPLSIIVALMNVAQNLMWDEFGDTVIHAGVERLWQPSAYLGSYGNLESAKIAAYVRKWDAEEGQPRA
jgi:REP element-mobilizing transposase RayT